MFVKNLIAAGALLSLVAAVPLQQMEKRDIITVTKMEEDVVTIPVTKTVWLEPGQSPPAGASAAPAVASAPESMPKHHGHHHKHHHRPQETTSIVQPSPPAQSPPAQSPPAQSPPASSFQQSPPSTPTTPAAPTHTQSPPSSGGDGITGVAAPGTSYVGDLTWYDTGLGACGWTSTAEDHIVAVSEDIFDVYGDVNPNDNPLCGKMVTITGANGSPYTAKIVDRCTGCAQGDLDLSEDFFNLVTNNGDGRVPGVHWQFD